MITHTDLDVITFGESMGLFYPEGSRRLGQGARLMQSFGGAESNVAIALARLGCRAGWFSLLGDDPIGHGIYKTLRGEGVDVSQVRFTKEAPTGLMLRENVRDRLSVYYYRRDSAASRLSPENVDPSYLTRGRILHFTGITPALSASCSDTVFEAVRLAKKAGLKVSFDPNIRLKLWTIEQARPVLLRLAEQADFFFPGYDELKLIYDTDQEDELLAHLRNLPSLTVIKSFNGHNLLVTSDSVVRVPFERIGRLVDPVGAGDGFTGGFLAGIVKEQTAEQSLRLAGVVGALTVQQEGDWESLPFLDEVEQMLSGSTHVER